MPLAGTRRTSLSQTGYQRSCPAPSGVQAFSIRRTERSGRDEAGENQPYQVIRLLGVASGASTDFHGGDHLALLDGPEDHIGVSALQPNEWGLVGFGKVARG